MNVKNLILICVILFMAFLVLKNYFDWGNIHSREGFNSFSSIDNYLAQSIIPQYNVSRPIYKIYDNIFFDKVNGNLIETVQLTDYSSTNDGSGNSIAQLLIIGRSVDSNNPMYSSYNGLDDNGNVIYQNTLESLTNTINSNATATWTYNTTTGYEVTYIPFASDTYIHVMNITTQSPTILISAYFTDPTQNGIDDYYLWSTNSQVGTSLGVTTGSYLGSPNNLDGTNVTEPYYDNNAPLYQISQYVKYDMNNGNLCVEGRTSAGNKNVTVYARNGNVTTYDVSNNATTLGGSTPSSQISSLPTNLQTPIIVNDNLNTNIIIYWPILTKTVIVQYQGVISSKNSGLPIVRSVKFINSQLSNTIASKSSSSTSTSSTDHGTFSMSDDALANYYKWYWYWNKYGGSDTQSLTNEYLLKTSIVPPVCPSCPSCPAVVVGGAGAGAGKGAPANGNDPDLIDKMGNAINRVGDYVGDDINAVGSFAGNSINAVGKFAANSINSVGSFAGKALSGTANATGNAAGNVVGGASNAVAGIANATTMPQGNTGAIYTGQQYIPDQYTYNGQMAKLPSSSSTATPDPLPLTADFSNFGR